MKGQNRKKKSNGETQPETHGKPLTIEERLNKIEQACTKKNCNSNCPEPKSKWGMSIYEFWSLWVSIGTGIATVVVVGVALFQFFDSTQTDLAQAQIDALADQVEIMQKQYQAEIKPIISITPTELPFVKNAKTVTITMEVVNLGKYPIQVKKGVFTTGFFTQAPKANDVLKIKPDTMQEYSMYVTTRQNEELRAPLKFTGGKYNPGPAEWNAIEAGYFNLYLIGEIFYINPIDDSKWRYYFCYRVIDPLAYKREFEAFESMNEPIAKIP